MNRFDERTAKRIRRLVRRSTSLDAEQKRRCLAAWRSPSGAYSRS